MSVISSTIVEVVVFPDRARVTRRGALTLDVGLHAIEFRDLPLALMPDSVRAAGRGTASATLFGVDTRLVYFTETPAVAAQEIENQLEALNDQDRALADQIAAAEMQAKFIQRLADQAAEQLARGFALGRSDINQGNALLAFMQQQLAQAQATVRDLNSQRRELARQITKLRNELGALQSARPRERYVATVEVEVNKAGELTLELTYMLGSASWQASYDVRVSNIEGEQPNVQLSYLAQVTQRTGEAWNDVALTLSTARPALASVRPELDPWYISPYTPPLQPPPMPRAALAMAPAAVAPSEVMYAAPPTPQVEMQTLSAQVGSEGASVTFKLAQRATIPSDGSPHKVNVTTAELKPRLDFISVPKLAEVAYRRAKLTNSSAFLLLPGQANLFVGGDFIGALPLKLIAPNEEFELTLGVDDRVFVKRELYARDVDKKLLGDRRRIRIGYEIEVRNLRGNRIQLELLDQLPVSRHEQIKVRLESADPKPSEQSELNELKWNLSLEPNEKRLVRFDFSVEHPTSMVVTGLP